MNQNERWLTKYNEIMDFIAENHRRPSKYNPEERNNWNWWRHTQKQLNAGILKPERVTLFQKLLELGDKCRHVNQYK